MGLAGMDASALRFALEQLCAGKILVHSRAGLLLLRCEFLRLEGGGVRSRRGTHIGALKREA